MNIFRPSVAASRVSNNSLRPTTGLVPPGCVSLGIGEPDFDTPEPIVSAMRQALTDGWTKYGDFHGDPELRQLIADKASALKGVPVSADTVLVTHGSGSGITATILAVVNPGDRVVIPEPTYSLYADVVRLAGAEPVFVPLTADNQLDVPAVVRAAQNARLVAVCNPGNPTGTVFTAESLTRLGQGLEGTDCLVLADEAYADFVYGVQFVSMLAIPSLQERVIYCQTLSKTYSMTGWRIGYLIAPPELAPWIRQVHRGFNASINAAVQRAAITALTEGPQLVAEHIRDYGQRRDLTVERLKRIPGIEFCEPHGAFYLLFRYPHPVRAVDMMKLLREHGVMVRAGSEYGPSGEGCLRISFAASREDIALGLDRIESTLASLPL